MAHGAEIRPALLVRGRLHGSSICHANCSSYGTGAAGGSANSVNQYTAGVTRPQAFDVTGTRATGSTAVTVNSAAPDYQQNATTGLYFRKEITHTPGTNGKYSPVTVTAAGSPTDSWQQYVPPAAEAMTYDVDGNLQTDGRWTYTWDGENRLIGMETAAQTAPPYANAVNGIKLVFTYDGLSRRIKKEVYSTQPSAWTLTLREHYVYDGWNLVLTARENNAAPTTTVKRHAVYVWGPDIGSLPFGRSDWQRAGGVDGLLMVVDGVNSALAYTNVDYNGAAAGLGTPPADPVNDDFFPMSDHLGNITGYFRAEYAGAVTPAAVYDYDAFGRELRASGPAADTVPFRFSSKFTDSETGLSYYGYRFYDPNNGRWLNRDPMGEDGGKNVYSWFNNCGNSVDVLGRNPYGHHLIPQALTKDCDQKKKDVCNKSQNRLDNDKYNAMDSEFWHGARKYGGVSGKTYNKCVKDLVGTMFPNRDICDLTVEEIQRLADAIKNAPKDSCIGKYNTGVEAEILNKESGTGKPADYPLPNPPKPDPKIKYPPVPVEILLA